jgi:Potential Queuosine, Q, salvage protein family
MHVTIDRSAVKPLAAQIRAQTTAVQWDEEDWHYQCPAEWPAVVQRERIAAYILALDAINFCFWPADNAGSYEYEDLATTLTRAAQADHTNQQQEIQKGKNTVSTEFVFSASNLESMSVEIMKELFAKHHSSGRLPPDMEKRCALWNEVGTVLRDKFNGSAATLIDSANGSAPALVHLLVENFPGFRDAYSGLYFYKRAQICAGDWNAALKLKLRDVDQLTTFADYRVPQLLRHYKVLVYSEELAAAVDANNELGVGSADELAIRATTVAAVELIVDELSKGDATTSSSSDTNTSWNAVTTDWYLWQVGERMQNAGELLPHHRVRTIFY